MSMAQCSFDVRSFAGTAALLLVLAFSFLQQHCSAGILDDLTCWENVVGSPLADIRKAAAESSAVADNLEALLKTFNEDCPKTFQARQDVWKAGSPQSHLENGEAKMSEIVGSISSNTSDTSEIVAGSSINSTRTSHGVEDHRISSNSPRTSLEKSKIAQDFPGTGDDVPVDGIPHKELMQRLREKRRLEASTCTDDSNKLATTLSAMHSTVASFSNFLTCSLAVGQLSEGSLTLESFFQTLGIPEDIAQQLGEISCTNDANLWEACLSMGKSEEDCVLAKNWTLADTCCMSCCDQLGTCQDEGSDPATPTLNGYGQEAQFLYDFLYDLDIEWTAKYAPTSLALCDWEGIDCENDGYSLGLSPRHAKIRGFFSEKLGMLQNLKALEIGASSPGSRKYHSFTSTLPANIGNCTKLAEIDFANQIGFIGPLPASLANLTKMLAFDVHNCSFSGDISQDMFLGWAVAVTIDLSNNHFDGVIPSIDPGNSRGLVYYNASYNSFSTFGSSVDTSSCMLATDVSISLDLSYNLLTVFPEAIRTMRRLGSLNLANNSISEIPAWGYWLDNDQAFNFINEGSMVNEWQALPCPWFTDDDDDYWGVEPRPEWPLLTTVTLSSNPIGSSKPDASFRKFLALFSQAPSLSTLRCVSCELGGEGMKKDGETSAYFYRQYLVMLPNNEQCTAQESYAKLQVLDLSDNPNILWNGELCDILQAEDEDSGEDSNFRCLYCPADAQVRTDKKRPLASVNGCGCSSSFELEYTSDSFQCFCVSGSFKDPVSQECKECDDYFDCSWDALGVSAARTKELPNISAGYWMPCISSSELSGDLADYVFNCFHEDVCLGGSIDANSLCTDGGQSLCASGRTGRACALCKPGHFGDREGDCKQCDLSKDEAQTALVTFAIVLIPILYVAIRILGSDDSSYAARDDVAASNSAVPQRTTSAAEVTSSIAAVVTHVSKHYDSVLRAMMMANLVFKSTQILALLLDLQISWPGASKSTLNVAARLGVNFDVMFQAGCMVDVPSVANSLSFRWLIPLLIVALAAFAWLLSHAVDRGLNFVLRNERLAGSIAVNGTRLLTFLFYLWSSFFAGLVKNSFAIFVCRENPNGKDTVLAYPNIICGEDDWWILALGGFLSCLVYVVCYFAAAILAFRRVASKLKETQCRERGAFTFAVEGLRTAALYWNIYAAGRDVCLNLIVATLVSQPGAQLLCAALVLLYYAKQVWSIQPYAAASLNFVEWWFSTVVALLLTTCSVFGYQSSSDGRVVDGLSEEGDWSVKEVIILILLLATVCVPILCALFEALCIIPFVYERVPAWMKHPTDFALKTHIQTTLDNWSTEQLLKGITCMDAREWSGFVGLMWGQEAFATIYDPLGVTTTKRRASYLQHLRLKDAELASVQRRHTVIQRGSSATISLEVSTKQSADPRLSNSLQQAEAPELAPDVSVNVSAPGQPNAEDEWHGDLVMGGLEVVSGGRQSLKIARVAV